MAVTFKRGRQLLRLGLLLFNALVVICIVLTQQMVREDLSKPSYHLDETKDNLADFGPLCQGASADLPQDCFAFGLATAPAHVEDKLDDTWLDFARATKPGVNPDTNQSKPLNVPAWHNVPSPEERVRFWTDPETEIQLAANAGVKEFRLGVDWGRLVRQEPVAGTEAVLDRQALEHYRNILTLVRKHGMRVMLTLFHHSMPKWAVGYGGWKEKKSIHYFVEFSTLVHREFGDLVDRYVLFNEAQIFATLSYCSGNWPPGFDPSFRPSLIQAVGCGLPKVGPLFRAIDNMIHAHREAYDAMRAVADRKRPVIGIAHFTATMRPWGLFDAPLARLGHHINRWYIPDRLKDKLDFIGLNYYGQEIVSGTGPFIAPGIEFSDSGRGIYPDGLYHTLWSFHQRYNTPEKTSIRFVVTENGIADDTDVLRPAYMVEHLLAVFAAKAEGVPVDGYFHWTLSDNWEWSDGYCPKFGLVRVDRANDFAREPRPSYNLYKNIVQTGKITREQRGRAWALLRSAIEQDKTHPFCRQVGPTGNVFAASLHEPVERALVDREWRFDKYKADELHDFLSVLARKVRPVFLNVKGRVFAALGWEETAPHGEPSAPLKNEEL